jgi:2-amino-4-hydroxy-6-hydroxymethyldihydropteridine diphosphokinase
VTRAFLGLGSNVGSREAHLAHAIHRLAMETRVSGLSSVYETEPVGFAGQGPFLNMVVRLETERSPESLLTLVHAIEAERGRVRTFRDAPRTLDIDVLLFGDREIRLEGLTVPHPRMNGRPFVLVPLLELAPELVEPVTGRSYRDILAGAGGTTGIERRGPADSLRSREEVHGE